MDKSPPKKSRNIRASQIESQLSMEPADGSPEKKAIHKASDRPYNDRRWPRWRPAPASHKTANLKHRPTNPEVNPEIPQATLKPVGLWYLLVATCAFTSNASAPRILRLPDGRSRR